MLSDDGAEATSEPKEKRVLTARSCLGILFAVGFCSLSLIRSDESVKFEEFSNTIRDRVFLKAATSSTGFISNVYGTDGKDSESFEKSRLESETNPDEMPRKVIGKKLNIVLLYADDWSFNMIGAMGNDYVKTPVLDQLAKEGILFTHNCVVASVCMQSRATLYTGQYSMRHQTYKSWADIAMYEDGRWEKTLYPLMMKEKYHVGFFGKFHHLDPPDNIPTFTKFKSAPYSHYFERNGVEKHVTQWNEEDGLEFLDDRPKNKPFFLTVSFFATHAEDGNPDQYRPMNSSMHLYADEAVPLPKTYTAKHWRDMPYFFDDHNEGRVRFRHRYNTTEMYQLHMKNTCRMVTEVDTACGNIISRLKEQGVYDDTLIIFTTDNGNMHGQHGLAEKWYAYEESLRTPLIIKDPRMPISRIGTKNSEFTLNIDLAPTILSAASVAVPNEMQGQDISPLYTNAEVATLTWRKEFLYDFHDANPNIPDSVAWVTKDSKYIYWDQFNYSQYFDLKADPIEEYDLIKNNVTDESRLESHKSRIHEYLELIKTDRTF